MTYNTPATPQEDQPAPLDPQAQRVLDSFMNAMAGMGMGTDNVMSGSTYGFNPVTRIRTLLEWIHRGSWIGGVAVDVIADDMTRDGVEITGVPSPEEVERMAMGANALSIWSKINEGLKWGRLYGGAIGVLLIEGQDLSTPLREETVAKGMFKGLAIVDRWNCEPSLEDLVEDYGPHMGLPKTYHISAGVAGLGGKVVHYTRVIRFIGIKLPYQQALQENFWGISILERLYDRMVAFDSATTGAAQLVYKSFIRTLKIKGYKDVVGEQGPAYQGMIRYIDMMRRFQSIEGINVIDQQDGYEVAPAPGFSGLADALFQFGQQIAGALQVPLVRLFGQSPAGLSSTGESDMRNYYDGIRQRQTEQLGPHIPVIYRLLARSEGIKAPEKVGYRFNPLWQTTEIERAEMAAKDALTYDTLFNSGVLTRGQVLAELRHQSQFNRHFTAITDKDIAQALRDDEAPPLPAVEAPERRSPAPLRAVE